MRNLMLLFSFLMLTLGTSAQDYRTVLIMNADQQLNDVKTIMSGAGKELNTVTLQQQLNAGYRIINVAYTSNGWIVALSKKSGIKTQMFKYEKDLDDKWIDQETKKGKICSAIVFSNDKCLMVMSEDPSITYQQVEVGYFDDMCDSYDKLVDKGYILTFAYPLDEGWVWSIAKSTKCKDQEAMVIRYSDLPNLLEYMDEPSRTSRLHHVLCCDDYAVIFFGMQTLNGSTAKQKVAIDPANASNSILTNKQSGFYLSGISGTIGAPYASDGNGNPTEGRLMTAVGNTAALQMGVVGGLFKDRGEEFYEAKECSKCGGSGKCSYCYGEGHKPSLPEERCNYCYGSGRCHECSGEGSVKPGFGDDIVANAAEMLPGLFMAQKQIDKEKVKRNNKGLGMPTRWEVRPMPSKKAVKQIQEDKDDNPLQVIDDILNIFK